MDDLILEPLTFYKSVGKASHHDASNAYFDELLARSGIDPEENRATAKQYRAQLKKAQSITKRWKAKKRLRLFLVLLSILFGIAAAVIFFSPVHAVLQVVLPILLLIGTASLLVFIFKKLNKVIHELDLSDDREYQIADGILQKAKEQMAPLNALFDDDDAKKLVEKTLPILQFEPTYSVRNAELFSKHFDFSQQTDVNTSILDLLSGTVCGNPFLFQRYLRHTMGTHTYFGSIVIRWTETYRDSEGRLRTRTRTQTLTASVEKPKPFYSIHTVLSYGCQGAPNLHFSRQGQHHERKNEKQIERHIRKGEKKLRKKAADALEEGRSFTEMANSEFDVLFGAHDRDNEVEFRLMFTPLAQNNMVDLMCKTDGYGDDFSFYKKGKYTVIDSEHAQHWSMDTSGSHYHSYDVDEARKNFLTFNDAYFKSIFFDLAPLLSIPLYQQSPAPSLEGINDHGGNFPFFEYESLANAVGKGVFAHRASATESILKTSFLKKENGQDCVDVTAYSYAAENRIDFVPMLGGDGRMHTVPVPWIEYIPIAKTSPMTVKELGLSENEFRRATFDSLSDLNAHCSGRSAYMHRLFGYALRENESFGITDRYFRS